MSGKQCRASFFSIWSGSTTSVQACLSRCLGYYGSQNWNMSKEPRSSMSGSTLFFLAYLSKYRVTKNSGWQIHLAKGHNAGDITAWSISELLYCKVTSLPIWITHVQVIMVLHKTLTIIVLHKTLSKLEDTMETRTSGFGIYNAGDITKLSNCENIYCKVTSLLIWHTWSNARITVLHKTYRIKTWWIHFFKYWPIHLH